MILPAMPYANVYHYEKTVTVYQNKTDQLPIVDISLDESGKRSSLKTRISTRTPTTAGRKTGKPFSSLHQPWRCGPAAVSQEEIHGQNRPAPAEYAKSHTMPIFASPRIGKPLRKAAIFSEKEQAGYRCKRRRRKNLVRNPEADLSAAMRQQVASNSKTGRTHYSDKSE